MQTKKNISVNGERNRSKYLTKTPSLILSGEIPNHPVCETISSYLHRITLLCPPSYLLVAGVGAQVVHGVLQSGQDGPLDVQRPSLLLRLWTHALHQTVLEGEAQRLLLEGTLELPCPLDVGLGRQSLGVRVRQLDVRQL